MRKVLDGLRYFGREASKSDWIGLVISTCLFTGGIFWFGYYASSWGIPLAVVGVAIPLRKYIF